MRKLEKILVYHHNDLDGMCSAAIVKYAMGDRSEVDFISLDYSQKELDLPENIKKYWRVYILDITLPEKTMKELGNIFERSNLIWIDHHISSIEQFGEKFSDYEGIRQNGVAACILTWRWFYGMKEIPKAVSYIGQRDIWQMGDDEEEILGLFEYLNLIDLEPDSYRWSQILQNFNLRTWIDDGKTFRNVRLKSVYDLIEEIAYESEIDGHKCLKVNYSDHRSISDMGHYIVHNLNYPVAWIYYIKKNGNGNFVVTNGLRSKNVDVSKIASKRGGGGHMLASGWTDYIENDACLHPAKNEV